MTAVSAPPRDLSVAIADSRLDRVFARLMLVSHRRHVAGLAVDPETLVVSTDWLAWRDCLDRGQPAIHFEAMLTDWPAERGAPHLCHQRHCQWVFIDGHDASRFDGVSLGKLFVRDVSLAGNAFERLACALDRACARFRPREMVLLDMRAELDLVDAIQKRQIAAEACARHGIELIDRLAAPEPGDKGFSERLDGYGAPLPDPWSRRVMRGLYTEALDLAGRVLALVRRRKPATVLILSNWATVRTLTQDFPAGVAPAIMAGIMPKRPKLLWRWLTDGVVPVSLPAVTLTGAEKAQIRAIVDAYEQAWVARPATGVELGLRNFIRQRIFATGWIEDMARQVKSHRRLFRRHRFSRVVLGDSTNAVCRIIAEVARGEGVGVDELLNGMFLTRQRYDSRCGDALGSPAVDRLLSWGRQNEEWAASTGGPARTVRTGYPALEILRRPAMAPLATGRALVLPIYADCDDTPAFTSNIFANMVETVAALHQMGCASIRVKLHPGPQNLDYYTEALRRFGLEAEIVKDSGLDRHLAWADFVVGPINSGAFVETLAAGKPYYPVCPVPSLIDRALLGPTPVISGAADLVAMLRAGKVIDRDAVLEYFCSFGSIGNAARRFWEVMLLDSRGYDVDPAGASSDRLS